MNGSRVAPISLLSLILLLYASPPSATAQDVRMSVLVAPFVAENSVGDDVSREMAATLRDSLASVDLLTVVDMEEVEDVLDELSRPPSELKAHHWKLLGSRLDAQLVVTGTVAPDDQGYAIDAAVSGPAARGTVALPAVQVEGGVDRPTEHAAAAVVSELRRFRDFLVARLNCEEYLSAGLHSDAVRNCERALELFPENVYALQLRARIERERENWQLAAPYLRRALDADSDDDDVLRTLARVEARLGNHETAADLLRRYIRRNRHEMEERVRAARALASAGDSAAADSILAEGLELDPGHRELRETRAALGLTSDSTAADRAEAGGRLRWQGTGDKSTPPFSVQQPGWCIRWAVRGEDLASIAVRVKDVETGRTVTTASSDGPGSDESYVYETGRFYLRILSANARWTVEIDRPE